MIDIKHIRQLRTALLCICLYLAYPFASRAQTEGEILLRTDFNKKSDLRSWERRKGGKIVTEDNNKALRVRSDNVEKTVWISYRLPLEKVKGAKLNISARYKGKDLSKTALHFHGVKLMIHAHTPSNDIWPQMLVPNGGSFDWREGGFQASIPAESDLVELILGIEKAEGEVWFDHVEVKVSEPPRPKPVNASTAMYKGHDKPRLRGAMVATDASADDLRVLAGWGANLVRWQLTWGGFPFSEADTTSAGRYREWLGRALAHVDEMLPVCRELGLYVVLDLHTLPGGRSRTDKVYRVFQDKEWQDVFRTVWKEMAERYKNEPIIWGYDLGNEPMEGPRIEGVMTWRQLAEATARDIRAIDTVHAIIIEGAPNGNQDALAQMSPIPVPGIVYSFHMYEPAVYTHQGLDMDVVTTYPGIIQDKEWNKENLRQVMQPVVQWQRDYNAHIYVGEFSAIRWAPGAYEYLRDCIDLFEEYGWDWSYHAFREWSGWSVEHDENKANEQPSPTATSRQKLMMDWFSKNKKD